MTYQDTILWVYRCIVAASTVMVVYYYYKLKVLEKNPPKNLEPSERNRLLGAIEEDYEGLGITLILMVVFLIYSVFASMSWESYVVLAATGLFSIRNIHDAIDAQGEIEEYKQTVAQRPKYGTKDWE